MTKILCVFLFGLLISNTGVAQQFIWAKSMGGANKEVLSAMAIDALGNIISTGHFTGSADFDPGAGGAILTSAGSGTSDVFIQKTDANGNFLWAKSIGGVEPDSADAVKTDAAGSGKCIKEIQKRKRVFLRG